MTATSAGGGGTVGPIAAECCADNPDMEDSQSASRAPDVGAVTTVMQRGVPSPVTCDGVFAGQRGFQVSVTVDCLCPFEPDEDVLLASGPLGRRAASLARFKGIHDNTAVFTKLSPWRPVDTRSNPRYRTSMVASVKVRETVFPATVLDISLGGVALSVPELPPSGPLEVLIGERPGAPSLTGEIVAEEGSPPAIVLHVQFGTMPPHARAYIAHLVGELCASIEPQLMAG